MRWIIVALLLFSCGATSVPQQMGAATLSVQLAEPQITLLPSGEKAIGIQVAGTPQQVELSVSNPSQTEIVAHIQNQQLWVKSNSQSGTYQLQVTASNGSTSANTTLTVQVLPELNITLPENLKMPSQGTLRIPIPGAEQYKVAASTPQVQVQLASNEVIVSSQNLSENTVQITFTDAIGASKTLGLPVIAQSSQRTVYRNSSKHNISIPALQAHERLAIIPLSHNTTGVSYSLAVSGVGKPETVRTVLDNQPNPPEPERIPNVSQSVSGETRDFWVSHIHTAQDSRISATHTYSAEHSMLYVDTALTLSSVQQQAFVNNFEKIYAITRSLFGNEADLDNNGKVIILVSERIVGGYVAADDHMQGSYNNADIIYACPSCFTPSLMAHELKHLIALNSRPNLEERWLEEGLAVVASNMAGYPENNQTDAFMQNPAGIQVFNPEHGYGASFLMAQYATDQLNSNPRSLLATSLQGKANIESALGVSFGDFFANWATAVMFSHANILTLSSYINLNPRNRKGVSGMLPLNYDVLGSGTHSRQMENVDFLLTGKGQGKDVTLTLNSTQAVDVVIVRFTGDLPY